MRTDVIDIYAGNNILDYDKLVAQGIKGIFHKASEGRSVQDSMYPRRRKAQNDRFLWGAYHFNSRSSSIKDQVANFLSVAEPDANTALAADWEGEGPAWTEAEAIQFLELLMSKTGRKPEDIWIYGGNILRERITPANFAFFGKFKNWHCQYGTSKPNVCKAWSGFDLWQWSESGQLEGTGSLIDLNVYKGTHDELRAAWAPGYSKGGVIKPLPPFTVNTDPRNKPVPGIPSVPAVPDAGSAIKKGAKAFWNWFKNN